MLREFYVNLSSRAIENRITRIIKKLQLHNDWTGKEDNDAVSPLEIDSDTDFYSTSAGNISLN